MLITREMAYPAPTKGFSQPSQDMDMLFTPFRCTHPPSPVPLFLLMQNLSPEDIDRYNVGHHEAESLTMHICVSSW